MKAFTIIAVVAALSASAYGRVEKKGLITWYNCKGKDNGDYEHPDDCTKFISCSNGYAYEMDCATCHISDGPAKCPEGKLHFHEASDKCEWAYLAQCSRGGNATEEPIEATTADDVSGDTCDPKDCKLEGHCTGFRKCNKETSLWEDLVCAEGLFWNPEWNAAEIGGSCDRWENLSAAVQAEYEEHDQCFPDCYFIEDGQCSGNYLFHPNGTDHRTLKSLSCPSDLIWDQSQETCTVCSEVSDSVTGAQCC